MAQEARRAMELLFQMEDVEYAWSSDKFTLNESGCVVAMPPPALHPGAVGATGPCGVRGPDGRLYLQSVNKYNILESPWAMNVLCVHFKVTKDDDKESSSALRFLLEKLQQKTTSPMLVCVPTPHTEVSYKPNPKYSEDDIAAFKAKEVEARERIQSLFRELTELAPDSYIYVDEDNIVYPTYMPDDLTIKEEVQTFVGTSFHLVCGDKTSDLRKMLREIDELFNVLPARERVICA